jgi:hypothetical protein
LRIYNNNSQLVRLLLDRVEQLETQSTAIVLASLPANTWTDFPTSNSPIKDFEVLTATGKVITDGFEYRQNNGNWQIYSLIAQTNLQIIPN